MADIVVNTYKLKQYAQRLENINGRIVRLDVCLDALYTKVGLLGLWNLIQADALIGYSWRIMRCKEYLQETASDFETAEQLLLGQEPANFKWPVVGGTVTTNASAALKNEKDSEPKSWFAQLVNNQIKTSGSVLYGEKTGEGEIWGISSAGTISGAVLTGDAGIKSRVSWKFKDKDGNWDFKSFGLSTDAKASGAIAKGEAEGNIGAMHGKVSGKALTGAIKGEAKATLWDDGEFNPSLTLGAKAEGSVLQGEAEAGFGTDQSGIYAKADGDILHAEAEAKTGIGYLGKDDDGDALYGASAEASAMASVAQGKVKGGITIWGIDIDVGVKGYAVSAGVEAGGSITTEGVTASFSGALGLGAGLDISVDWSDAEWIGGSIDAVGDFFEGAGDVVGDVGDFLFGWIG